MESLLVQNEQGTWVTDGSLADTDVAGETLVVTPTALTSNLYGSSTTWSFEVDCSTARVDYDTFSMITYDVDFMGAGFTGGACEFMQVSEDVRSCCKTPPARVALRAHANDLDPLRALGLVDAAGDHGLCVRWVCVDAVVPAILSCASDNVIGCVAHDRNIQHVLRPHVEHRRDIRDFLHAAQRERHVRVADVYAADKPVSPDVHPRVLVHDGTRASLLRWIVR